MSPIPDGFRAPRPRPLEGGNAWVLLAVFVLLVGAAAALFLLFGGPAPESDDVDGTAGIEKGGIEADTPPPPGDLPAPARREPRGPEAGEATAGVEPASRAPSGAVRLLGVVVRAADAQPIDGALVRFFPTPPADLRSLRHDPLLLDDPFDLARVPAQYFDALGGAQTDRARNGRFELLALPAELPGALVAGAPGYAPEILEITAATAGTERELRIELRHGTSISGTVTVRDTGEPATGMVVLARPASTGSGLLAPSSDPDAPRATVREDGTYELSGVPPAEYDVLPRSEGTAFLGLSSRDAKRVFPKPGAPAESVDFEVERGGSIAGRVTGGDGFPLAGASVSIAPASLLTDLLDRGGDVLDALAQWTAETGADGAYRITGVPFDRDLSLLAQEDRHAPRTVPSLVLTREQPRKRIDLTLDRGATVSGTVRFPDRRLAPGVRVNVLPDIADLMAGSLATTTAAAIRSTTSDDEGRFTVEHLPPGKFRLAAGGTPNYTVFAQSGTEIEITGVETISGVELTVEDEARDDIALSGIVVDDRGVPIPDAKLVVSCYQADFTKEDRTRSGEDGSFRLSGFGSRPISVRVTHEGHSPERREDLSGDTAGAVIRMDRTARVTGRVRTPLGEVPADGFEVTVRSLHDDFFSELEVLGGLPTLDADATWREGEPDGTFSIPGAPTGRVEIVARAPGFADGTSGELVLGPAESVEGIEIVLLEGGVVQGRVVRPDGSVFSHASVELRPVEEGAARAMRQYMPGLIGGSETTSTSAAGEYRFTGLTNAELELVASAPKHAPSDPVRVRAVSGSAVTAPDLVLYPGAVVEIRVTEGGSGLAGVLVQLAGPGPVKMGTSSATGKVTFDGLPAGDHLLTATDMADPQAGMRLQTRHVTLGRSESAEVEVSFGDGFDVSGSLEGFEPGAAQMVTLRRPEGFGPEEYDPLEVGQAIEAGRHQVGFAMVLPGGKFRMRDIPPGEYLIEIPVLPDNVMDFTAYSKMDRTPWHRSRITVDDEDLEGIVLRPTR